MTGPEAIGEATEELRLFDVLAAEIERAAQFSSWPAHQEIEAYREVVNQGDALIPELLAGGWDMKIWEMQALIEIADNIGNPIDLPEGASYSENVVLVVSWARHYLESQNPE